MQERIGIIGGSGFYQFLEPARAGCARGAAGGGEEVVVNTPYGAPSDKVLICRHNNREIVFLPRHGKSHQLPPHRINYRANLFALRKLGVKQIIAPCAVGSLKPEIEPGHFLVADQFIDQTKNRENTYFNGPKAVHISMEEPYCSNLRQVINQSCDSLGLTCHHKGTVLVIEGPRFSSKAESDFYSQFADVINMTQCPEVILARELGLCYANVSLVTDYDTGLRGRDDIKAVTADEVKKVFNHNNQKVRALILKVIESLPVRTNCFCASSLENAVL